MRQPYEVLGLQPGASGEQIDEAYRLLRAQLDSDQHRNHPQIDLVRRDVDDAYRHLAALAEAQHPTQQMAAVQHPAQQMGAGGGRGTPGLARGERQLPPEATVVASKSKKTAVLAVALTLSLLLCAGLGYALYDTYQTGLQWQERTVVAQGAVDELLQHVDELLQHVDDLESNVGTAQGNLATAEQDLAAAEEDLSTSEADVARLERRITDLANEQAQVADQRNLMVLEASLWRDLTEEMIGATDSLDACIDLMTDLHGLQVDAWTEFQEGEIVDVGALNRIADDTFRLCGDARDDAWALRDRILGL